MHNLFHASTVLKATRCYFGGASPPPPPAAPKPPSLADAAGAAAAKSQGTRIGGGMAQGFGSTILTSGQGVQNQTSQKKTLLGS